MLEELDIASNLLDIALARYLIACSAIENCSLSRATSDHVTNEITRAASYETRIQKAKAAISRARNRSFLIVPINYLPAEILARIFGLVYDSVPFCGDQLDLDGLRGRRLPRSPDLLLLVCSHWRQILTSSHNLWSHIDLVPHHKFSQKLFDRAEIYAARAGQSPLAIHILDPDPHGSTQTDAEANLLRFLASVATRMMSLDLAITYRGFADFHRLILQTCFANAVPGMLTRLRISDESIFTSRSQSFFEAAVNPNITASLLLDIPQQLLESHLHSITVLQLRGLYPYWTSNAYRGLVELRLTALSSNVPAITESQLVAILTSSPRLRILLLNVTITDSTPLDSANPLVPVSLVDLEILNAAAMSCYTLGQLLRLLAPGSNPLQLAMPLPSWGLVIPPGLKNEINKFFARSNITNLHVHFPNTYFWLTELLELCPRLRVLAIHKSQKQSPSPAPQRESDETLPARLRLENLYMLWSSIDFEDLRYIIESCPIQTLTLWNSEVFCNNREVSDKQELTSLLSQFCPVVRLLTRSDPNPVGD